MSELPRSFRVEAVVLRHNNYGESDRLINLYSREHGKLRAIAKGVRKIKSRKAGHLEPFTQSTIQLARGHDLLIVTQAETISSFPNIRASLELTAQCAVVVELLDRFTYETEENKAIYKLLIDTLIRLDGAEDPFITVSYYEIRLLEELGYRPELFACAECRREVKPEDQYFSAEKGGAICPQCANKVRGARPISMNALKYLRHLQRSSFSETRRANPDPNSRAEMDEILQFYITYILERGLNAPGFLKEIHKPGG